LADVSCFWHRLFADAPCAISLIWCHFQGIAALCFSTIAADLINCKAMITVALRFFDKLAGMNEVRCYSGTEKLIPETSYRVMPQSLRAALYPYSPLASQLFYMTTGCWSS
jgi:hypothetical protein